jgi:DNA-binding transcriptional regulator YdaS (Cro superfamily)
MEQSASPVDKVIAAFGGLTKAATALGIDNPSVIANWRTRGQVPADKVLAVEAASRISRHELRPDIFGVAPTSPKEGEAA